MEAQLTYRCERHHYTAKQTSQEVLQEQELQHARYTIQHNTVRNTTQVEDITRYSNQPQE
jgi:hypothetical protein